MAKENLRAAQAAKNDEFYTQWVDIEKEMSAYLDYDPDVFKNKIILLPCDDPEWSNFTKYFAQNFGRFGIKKLISTSYAEESKSLKIGYQPTQLEYEDPRFDESKTSSRGKIFTLSTDNDGDGKIDIDDLEWDYLQGDGDFRSDEVKCLRDEADIIITNPPFSLFRKFLAWIVEAEKSFCIIGNMNAMTYREVFPLVMANQLWYGPSISSGDREFGVPDSYPLKAAGHRTDEDGNKFIQVKGVRWFTNLEHGRRHEPLPLMTMADNRKFNKRIQANELAYKEYDNYAAIEIPYTSAIPGDFKEVMGVPITFLDKYCPEQFEIVGTTKPWAGGRTKMYPRQIQHGSNGKQFPATKLNDGPVIRLDLPPSGRTYYTVNGVPYIQLYARILITAKEAA